MQKLRLCCFIVEVMNCRTIFLQTFDEQFVAVDDVRPTVSDGLYSKCASPPPTPRHLSVFYTTSNNNNKKDPKCTASNLTVFQCEHCVTKRRSAR